MKDIFTEGVVAIICALVAFLFFTAGIFYIDHQSTLMRFHCRSAAIQHGYTAAEVQVVCSKASE